MSVYQTIYETLDEDPEKVRELLGSGDVRVILQRRSILQEFLEENDWDEDAFKQWQRSRIPKKSELFKNVAASTATAIISGFEKVDDEEQEKRLSICREDCAFYIQDGTYKGRCGKCGCWVAFKVQLSSWHCPLKRW